MAEDEPFFFWSDGRSVNSMSLFGTNRQAIDSAGKNVTSMLWHQPLETLFWSEENMIKMKTGRSSSKVIKTEKWPIKSMALDFFGNRIYYSVPELQSITRLTFSGKVELTFPMSVMAKDLVIDSQLAKICWVSHLSSVYCSNLDGENQVAIHELDLWNDTRIISIAADPGQHKIYILMYNPMASAHYRLLIKPLLKGDESVNKMNYDGPTPVKGPYQIHDSKFIYKSDASDTSSLVMYDILGQSYSQINLGKPIESFAATANLADIYPDGLSPDTIKVLPDQVDAQSVRLSGSNGKLTLIWDPVTNINYGSVSYQVNLHKKTWLATSNSLYLSEKVELNHFQSVNVSITAKTAWAISAPAQRQLVSPEFVPSQPLNVRAFWYPINESITKYTIRWDPPEELNGQLLHYIIQCFDVASKVDVCNKMKVGAETTSVDQLLESTREYDILVAGETNGGWGKFSKSYRTVADISRPVSLVAYGVDKPPMVVISDPDLNSSNTYPISNRPVHISYLSSDKLLYVVDDQGIITKLNITSKRSREFYNTGSHVQSTTIDHLGRYLYWATNRESGSSIQRVDLDEEYPIQQFILSHPSRINQICYQDGKLLFTAESQGDVSDASLLYINLLS